MTDIYLHFMCAYYGLSGTLKPRLAGRAKALQDVYDAFGAYLPSDARSVGGPSVLFVDGIAGIGKTKLLQEANARIKNVGKSQ